MSTQPSDGDMTRLALPPARSYLYVPGDRPDRLAKALERCGDAMIVDLEDAVPAARKDLARAAVRDWLTTVVNPRAQIWVRVNPGAAMRDDITAAAAKPLTGIVVPKADVPTVAQAIELLDAAESGAGLGARTIRISPLVESAVGLLAVAKLAGLPRVSHLGIGEADLFADLGVDPRLPEALRAAVRLPLVIASAATGIAPPTGPVDTDVRDMSRLGRSTVALRQLGFGARSAIHPDQVRVIEAAFTPSADEIAAAREAVAGYESAGGVGSLDPAGRFVDEAVVRSSRRILAVADRAGRSDA